MHDTDLTPAQLARQQEERDNPRACVAAPPQGVVPCTNRACTNPDHTDGQREHLGSDCFLGSPQWEIRRGVGSGDHVAVEVRCYDGWPPEVLGYYIYGSTAAMISMDTTAAREFASALLTACSWADRSGS